MNVLPSSRYPTFEYHEPVNNTLKLIQHVPTALAWAIERYGDLTGYIPRGTVPRVGPTHRGNDWIYSAVSNLLRNRSGDTYLP
jgi:hypothetical protein